MEIKSELDIKRLSKYLKAQLKDKKSVAVDVMNIDAPTTKQLRLIYALAQELSIQSAQLFDAGGGLSCEEFLALITNLFFSDYIDIDFDGSAVVRPASFKGGMTKQGFAHIVDNVIEYFNSNYGFDLYVKEPAINTAKDISAS